jgi:chromosome partitioning protein
MPLFSYQTRCKVILTVGNTKGGVGKTTIALNLAVMRAREDRTVLLVDGDRQATLQKAVAARDDVQPPDTQAMALSNPTGLGIACASYCDGKILRQQVLAQSFYYDDIVIDAGGRDSSALRAALLITDTLLVPFAPRSYDVWALDDISEIVQEARTMRAGQADLRALAVLNQADPGENAPDNLEAAALLADLPALEWLDAPLRRRKAFANAAGAGLSVIESRPADLKAIGEIHALYSAVFQS